MDRLHDAGSAFVANRSGLYLDCAAQAPLLRSVHAAARQCRSAALAAWRRGDVPPLGHAELLRERAARLFDGDVDGVAIVPSAAYGIATAARNLPLRRGQAVLVLDGQFPSNLLAWQQRCAEVGARLAGVQRGAGQDWTSAVLATLAADPSVAIVAVPQVRWDDGSLLDLDAIAADVHARGAALVLDLSQSLGVLAAEVARWRPDFAVAVGYKWLLGVRSLALLWVAPHWREHGDPIEHHWSARDAGDAWRFPLDAMPPYARGARRFDAGGLDEPQPLAMALAGLDQVLAWTPAAIAVALRERLEAFDATLSLLDCGDWSTPGHAPHITALHPPPDLLDVVTARARRAGIACTQRHGRLRIAPHLHVPLERMHWAARVLAGAPAAGG